MPHTQHTPQIPGFPPVHPGGNQAEPGSETSRLGIDKTHGIIAHATDARTCTHRKLTGNWKLEINEERRKHNMQAGLV